MRTKSARAAQAIRKELKNSFPGIKFSVRSDNYSGGNAVRISYMDGVPESEIKKIVNKYQYGSFDGMIGLYEITNSRDDIPQVEWVQISRTISEGIREYFRYTIADEFGIDPENKSYWMATLNEWPQQTIWRKLMEVTL